MIKYFKSESPAILNFLFQYNNQFHNYATRQQAQFRVPFFHTSLGQRSIRYRGVLVYGRIGNVFNCNHSIITIKQQLRRYLLDNDIAL